MLSCVVVNYHTPDDLHKYVVSWCSQSFEDTELLIIDVDPTHKEASDVAEWLAPLMGPYDIAYWPMDYNCGYSGACNFAAELVDGDVLAFFNADTVLNDDTLEKCYEAILSRPDWGILGPLQYDSQGRATFAGIFGTNAAPRHRGWRKSSLDEFRDVRDDSITVSGSAFFIRREVWDELANDERFREMWPEAKGGAMLPTPHYYEETWVSYFARAKGWKIVYYGLAEMIHEWHKSSPLGGKTETQMMPQSRKMFRETCDFFGIEHD